MKVKICGITDKTNLDEILKLNPDYLGFIFFPASPRYMADKLDPEDLLIIPKKVKRVGVFVNADVYEIDGIYWKYNLDFVQLHGDESPSFCRQLNETGIKIIKAFRLDEDFDFDRLLDYVSYCDYFLFDTNTKDYGGSGLKFNWEILHRYKTGHPFFLSGGIGPYDARELKIINHAAYFGIDLNSRFETSPGMKNIGQLSYYFKKLKNDK